MKIGKITRVYKTTVWVEGDMLGNQHVMVQHQAPECDPFCYCTFHYNYYYTDNSKIRREAERMALSIGAKKPVEFRNIKWPTMSNTELTTEGGLK